MEKKYYVNAHAQLTPKKEHEVHEEGCLFFPKAIYAVYLGAYESCVPAVAVAKAKGYNANGCVHCCPRCHTS